MKGLKMAVAKPKHSQTLLNPEFLKCNHPFFKKTKSHQVGWKLRIREFHWKLVGSTNDSLLLKEASTQEVKMVLLKERSFRAI